MKKIAFDLGSFSYVGPIKEYIFHRFLFIYLYILFCTSQKTFLSSRTFRTLTSLGILPRYWLYRRRYEENSEPSGRDMSLGQKRAGILDTGELSRRHDVDEDGCGGRITTSVTKTFSFISACHVSFVMEIYRIICRRKYGDIGNISMSVIFTETMSYVSNDIQRVR